MGTSVLGKHLGALGLIHQVLVRRPSQRARQANLGARVGVMLFVLLPMLFPALASASEEVPEDRWSVLLMTVAALRPDHMSAYGYERDTTPFLTEFAKESLVFEKAFATSAWTSPGIFSLMTGYYPPVHGLNGRYSVFDAKMKPPLKILAAEGYDILGVSLDDPSIENLGFTRELRPSVERSLPAFENLIESRSENGRPFFAWVHLREAHLPYAPSARNAQRWGDTSASSPAIEAIKNHYIILRSPDVDIPYRHSGGAVFDEKDVEITRALYDGEVSDVDERLQRFMGRMKDSGLLNRTVVIISADHGEELFEHGWVGHPSTSYEGKLYDELTRIPLIIRLPAGAPAGRYDALVQGVDLMPTLFELLGLDPSQIQPAMQGRSLLDLVNGRTAALHEHIFSQTTLKGWTTPREEMSRRVLSVRTQTHKLISIPDADGVRLEGYDLREDPGETNNIYPSRSGEFADLKQAAARWNEENRKSAVTLIFGAANERLHDLVESLEESDLLAAVENWQAIERIHQSWKLEPEPFFATEPHRTAWQDLRRSAARMTSSAITCAAEGGALKSTSAADMPATAKWICDK